MSEVEDDENVVSVVTGLKPKKAPTKKVEISEDEAAEQLEETLFGESSFPGVLGPKTRGFTWKFVYKGTIFYCVALPPDVTANYQRRLMTLDQEATRQAKREEKLLAAQIVDLRKQREAEWKEADAKASEPLTAVQIAEREIALDDEIDALKTADLDVQEQSVSNYMGALGKLMKDVVGPTVNNWHDERWQKPVPCTLPNIEKALKEIPDKLTVMQIIVNYSQSGEIAADFLAQSILRD